MARWRLMKAHYLNVPGTEWEHKETDRSTGKQARKIFEVPRLLNPDDMADHNYPGEIIVAHSEDRRYRNDIIFVGPPTPEMEPIDEEAEAISEAESPKWAKAAEIAPGDSYGDALIAGFQRQIEKLIAVGQPAQPVPNQSIDPAKFAQMQEQLAALMEANAKLQAQLAENPVRRL